MCGFFFLRQNFDFWLLKVKLCPNLDFLSSELVQIWIFGCYRSRFGTFFWLNSIKLIFLRSKFVNIRIFGFQGQI